MSSNENKNNKTQSSIFFFQNPNSGCLMVLRNHYGEYRVVCDSARDDEPPMNDQDDALEYTEIVNAAEDDDHAIFCAAEALGLDADGDLV